MSDPLPQRGLGQRGQEQRGRRRSRLFPVSSGALLLSALLSLTACADQGVGGALPDDPYAGGVSYPWTDQAEQAAYPWTGPGAPGGQSGEAGSDLHAAALTGDNFLSDVSWTPGSASSAWGPIEKDRSNGEKNAGDGRTLTIGGQTFEKGLGVHANSEVSYALGGSCSVFVATLGVDDEVGDRGSVVFQVWNGTAEKLYDSGVLRGTDAPREISVPVSGVSNLRLVVGSAGDGISADHADWAAARVSCPSAPPTTDAFVSDLAWSLPSNGYGPIEQDRSNGGKGAGDGLPLTVGGQTYAKGLGMHANGGVSYTLERRCRTFTASVGVDDEVGDLGSVVFQVYADGTKVADSGVRRGADGPQAISVDVTGVNELRLVVTDAGDGLSADHADWGNARVTCANGSDTAAPPAPTGLSASGGGAGITLDWTDVSAPDFAGYRLDRAAPDGPFLPVTPGLLKTSGFADASAPEGAASRYRVVAVDTSGNASDAAAVSANRPPAPPANSLSYSPVASQPHGVSEAQGRAVNGKVYTFGGFDSLKGCCTPTDRAYVYEPALNVWTPLPPMPDRGATHAGMTSDGAHIYYAGGYVANSSWTGQIFGTKAAWRYDIAAQRYARLPDLPVERAGGQLEYLNGKLHYFGGTNLARTRDVGDHFVLDLTGGAAAWTVAAPLPNPRHHMGSAVLNGLIYAVGGQHGHDSRLVTQASVHTYDPATDSWTARRDLPSARGHISSATFVLGGRLIVAGGERAHGQSIAAVNAYDPATDSWAALTSLPSGRHSGVAGPLGNGFLYTTGNGSRSGWRAAPLGTP